ncbi:MAG: hypothetical protein ACJ77N_05325 [Chloroflexota bacterium]
MNDEQLERELRAWYDAEVDDSVVAPTDLRDEVRAIPTTLRVRNARVVRRPTVLLLAAAVATTAVIGSAIVGSAIVRPPRVSPPPSDAALVGPTPSAAASTVPEPSPTATATPTPILGGGLILAVRPHSATHTCNTTAAPFDVVTVDPASGATTVLGTTSKDCAVRPFEAHWAADRTKILLFDGYRPKQLDVATVTDAGRALPVVCCDLPPYLSVWEDGGSGGQGWSVSPRGGRVAAVHTARPNVGDAIIVSDIDGQNVRRLLLPDGANARGGFAWSPDESTIAVAACRPCNTAQPGQRANAAERWHVYLVPVDGSAVRTLLSTDAGGTSSQPAWAPDGSSVAVVMTQCASGETPPACTIGRTTSALAIVDAGSGGVDTIVGGTDLGRGDEIEAPSWGPDGIHIRFQVYAPAADRDTAYIVGSDGSELTKVAPRRILDWSPDGRWFLVRRNFGVETISIGSIDGGPLRELGSFTAVDW